MKKIYGLIGFPLSHSFSAKYFTEKFKKEGIDAEYHLFPLPDLKGITNILDKKELMGFNVTIPYKEKIMDYLDYVSPQALAIGAVNVVKIERDKDGNIKLSGYNTDYIGFMESFQPLINSKCQRALILGTGGASKAVDHALRDLGFETRKVSRNPDSFQIGYCDLENQIDKYPFIVNTTPRGTYPNIEDYPDIPYFLLSPEHVCFDLIYNPPITGFMCKAGERGATLKNGLEMLHLQAEAAWKIWNNQ